MQFLVKNFQNWTKSVIYRKILTVLVVSVNKGNSQWTAITPVAALGSCRIAFPHWVIDPAKKTSKDKDQINMRLVFRLCVNSISLWIVSLVTPQPEIYSKDEKKGREPNRLKLKIPKLGFQIKSVHFLVTYQYQIQISSDRTPAYADAWHLQNQQFLHYKQTRNRLPFF